MSRAITDHVPIEISIDEYHATRAKDTLLIDCRTVEEFEEGHLQGALMLPLQHITVRLQELSPYRNVPVFIYCKSGNRSGTLARYLRTIGFLKSQSICGGFETWGESNKSC
ncbi:MAG: rhodanese-like domain-containing protein [Planctomycetes bacterium]|nr:rhodanese-like domain-containing protein [Planctomycetota bacterium]